MVIFLKLKMLERLENLEKLFTNAEEFNMGKVEKSRKAIFNIIVKYVKLQNTPLSEKLSPAEVASSLSLLTKSYDDELEKNINHKILYFLQTGLEKWLILNTEDTEENF